MIIGIDIDDTIADTYACLFPHSQKYTIEELGKEIVNIDRNCNMHMYTSAFHRWNEEEEKEFLDKYYEKTLISVKPKLYAVEVINKLKNEGHTICIITARFLSELFDVKEETEKWLKNNNIYYDKLILNAQDKVKVAKEENIDIFIDDSIKNCKEMAEAKIKTYIMDTVVNLNYQNNEIERVYSWPHLYERIRRFKEENK